MHRGQLEERATQSQGKRGECELVSRLSCVFFDPPNVFHEEQLSVSSATNSKQLENLKELLTIFWKKTEGAEANRKFGRRASLIGIGFRPQ